MDNIKSISSSVLEILEYNKIIAMLSNETSTIMGKELAQQLKPDGDFSQVSHNLAETEEAFNILNACHNAPLGGIRDVREIVKRAELGAVLEPHQLLSVADTLRAARSMKSFFAALPPLFQDHILKELSQNITVLKNLEDSIHQTVTEQGTVRDEASASLARIRRDIRHSQNRVKEKIDAILRNTEYQKFFQDLIVTIRRDRYVIPVKQEYRNNFPGVVHDQSSSGATLFIEPMAVVNLNNDLRQLMISEESEVERILLLVSAKVAQAAQPIGNNSEILAKLDLSFAKAKLALAMQAVKPVINKTGYINLIAARHPLLKSDRVVPIDFRLGRDFHTLLITGPNTGGKTVALKTVGLFALMLKAGLFIPASADSTMPVIKNIFADIGDEQSIEQSLSTFSSHMANIVSILSKVTAGDLVLVDEIGAGTDPDEGAALAMSILEHLSHLGAKTIATTHYSELKTFAYTRNEIENASVEFDIKTLSPTYRLLIGLPGGSNAFAVSLKLGLDSSIIERAKELINKEHADFEEVLSALEEQKRTYAAKLDEIEKMEKNIKIQQKKLKNEELQLTEKKNNVIIKTKDEAAAIIREIKRETEDIIKELKEQFSEKDSRARQSNIEEARRKLKEASEQVGKFADCHLEEDRYNELPPLDSSLIKPGSMVYVTAFQQEGEVLEANQDTITIQMGVMKANVPITDCRLLEKKGQKPPYPPIFRENRKKSLAKIWENDIINLGKFSPRRIDIRGLTIEEAQIELDKYIDGAILSGLNEVLIIHGKGTGALRKGVKQYLETHPKVKGNQIAETNEGGYGATIAKLL